MQKQCVVTDLDGTVVFYKDYDQKEKEYKTLNLIFAERGVQLSEVRRIYKNVVASGFSPERFVEAVAGAGYTLDADDVLVAIHKWANSSLVAYSDACDAMRTWREAGIPVLIATTGEESWQRFKVRHSGLPHAEWFAVGSDTLKLERIKQMGEIYARVVVFDDKPGVLDALRDADPKGERFRTVRVLRDESKYRDEDSRRAHLVVTSMTDPKITKLFA